MANYSHSRQQRRTGGTADAYIMQGFDPTAGQFGHQGSLTWYAGQAILGEVGTTLTAAMAGAQLDSGKLDVYGAYKPGNVAQRARAYWHEYTTAPNSMVLIESHLIGEFHVPHGGRGTIQLPPACLAAIQDGTFAGIGFYKGDRDSRYALGMGWATPWQRPNLTLNYTR
jgi:hypothetical protein